jgi:hypothetical protein
MEYLTGLIFMELSHLRGDAVDPEHRYPTERRNRRKSPILRTLIARILRDGRKR